MQTFMPYTDFQEVARCLDNRRLGKQRIEAYQIITTIETNAKAWSNHPAVNMWRGYTGALRLYHDVMITEWIARGFKNTMRLYGTKRALTPPWLERVDVIESHRAALYRKDPVHYIGFKEFAERYAGYIWPIGRV